jgi:hypothetical protein
MSDPKRLMAYYSAFVESALRLEAHATDDDGALVFHDDALVYARYNTASFDPGPIDMTVCVANTEDQQIKEQVCRAVVQDGPCLRAWVDGDGSEPSTPAARRTVSWLRRRAPDTPAHLAATRGTVLSAGGSFGPESDTMCETGHRCGESCNTSGTVRRPGCSRGGQVANKARDLVTATIDGAVNVSGAEIERFIRGARLRRENMPSAELVKALERSYTALVATTGAAAGGVAAAPAIGLPGGLVAGIADAGAFTAASAVYVLAVASVHGIEVEDIDRRKTLLLTVLAGPGGVTVVERAAGRTGAHWGRRVTQSVSMDVIHRINGVLGKNFVTKYGTKQGILVLGKVVPFGLGAAIGMTGNAVMARMVVRTTRSAFGPLPTTGTLAEPLPGPK